MPYPHEHAARIKDPGKFDPKSFRRTDGGIIYGIKNVPKTIAIIWGKLKGKSKPRDMPIPQSLRFPVKNWTAGKAKEWLKKKHISYIRFEPAKKSAKQSEEKESKMKVEKLPRQALTFRESVGAISLAENQGKDVARRFRMVAMSGKPILNHWYWGNLAIDLKGVQIGSQKKPALREHMRDRIVGYTDKITKDGQIAAEGQFSKSTPDGVEVLGLADEGFPWEVSVFIPPLGIETVAEGQTVEVNGFKLMGPGTVFRKSRLREVSFCALGADEHTKAVALAEERDLVTLEVEEINACREEELSGEPKEEEGSVEELTMEKLKEENPDLAKSLLAEGKSEGLQEGAKQEQERIAGIRAAAFEDMEELTTKFVEDGVSVEDAARRFNEREKERKADKLASLASQAPETTGPGSEAPEEGSSNLTVEEKAKKEFAKSPALREEFGSEACCVAFMKAEAEGRVKILGSREKK